MKAASIKKMKTLLIFLGLILIEQGQSCPQIISRSRWGARSSKCSPHLSTPVQYAVIHHTEGSACSSQASCIAQVKSIQNYHMNNRKWCDIGYSFLIGGDGNVYEGVGWNTEGAHVKGYNRASIGISFIGSFTNSSPTTSALNAAKRLIACARSKNKLKSNYVLKGHRQLGSTACPGNKLYSIIKGWPHYKA